ncbi:MAG TPA: hypothetical protein PKC99_12605 [Anaerolineales bacterium]|nr:hypothetical protein [Anaerolineales bacterium]
MQNPIVAKAPASNFQKLPLPEAGTTRAVCCGVWDLGLQKIVWNGKEKIQHKIVIAWEIEQTIDSPESEYHGKRYMLSRRYTLSLGDKARLRQDLEAWRGKPLTPAEITNGFDVSKLYGVNCLLGVTHTVDNSDPSKTYANITSILPPMRGAEQMTPERGRDEEPPRWVAEIQAAAIPPQDNAAENFPSDDDPFAGGEEPPHY